MLTGFTRLEPANAFDDDRVASLSLLPKPWLPGIEVRGEGVFIVLRDETVDEWETDNTALAQRVGDLERRYQRYLTERRMFPRPLPPRSLLVHTLAHLLIRQLIFDCGYDSASLRERLYVSTDSGTRMCGLLIYTASGDAEGTLGGLVRQGEPGRLEGTFKAALQNAEFCSSDPLCMESPGQGTNSLNYAACHACTLLPETSCEQGNRLLDRVSVIGTGNQKRLGYLEEFRSMD